MPGILAAQATAHHYLYQRLLWLSQEVGGGVVGGPGGGRGENMDMVALTVTIIDMLYLQVWKHQLQVQAGAALLVASKSCARSLTMNRILFYLDTAGTRDTLLAWEKLILLNTKFNMSLVVAHDFLPHLISL